MLSIGGDGSGARLLLVEDDEPDAALAATALSRVADVTHVTNAEEAIGVFGQASWDLVVTGVSLPWMGGIELVARLREIDPNVSMLVLSSQTAFELAVAAIRAGANDYVTKPFEEDELCDNAAKLMKLTRAHRAKNQDVVLAIGAHPDDVEIGCGGILLRHIAVGDRVAILTLTGGEVGGTPSVRANEAATAADLIGGRLFLTDLPDTSVSEGGETISTIERVVAETGANTVYVHGPHDVHQDHRNAHRATLAASRGVSRIYCYQSPSSSVEFVPRRFVSIDGFMETKLELIAAYQSQAEIRPYLDPELLRATARYWARFTNAHFVEPLEVFRETHSAVAFETFVGHGAPALTDVA